MSEGAISGVKKTTRNARPLVLLAAGGTGGHLFPAQALAGVLASRGIRVELATDERAAAYATDFPADKVHVIPSATPSRRSIPVAIKAALTLARGIWKARGLAREIRPAVVVGFGGYPSVPPLLGASFAGTPTIIHEQNAVFGRANRFLAPRATAIATGFASVGGLTGSLNSKATQTGNPIRPAVIEAARKPFSPLAEGGMLHLLVTGGSQGARVMSDIVPAAIEKLSTSDRSRLSIVQQARAEDVARVEETYRGLGVRAEIAPFFKDLPARIADAHLVIGRAGASTVAELAIIGRPSILVPLPGALDQDQAANAATLGSLGAATVIPQDAFTPERLAAEISERLVAPGLLTQAAEAAKSAGIPDSADRLADLVVRVGHIDSAPETRP
ncbi:MULTISPECIES: undecaprenyldiphospho-muramoylpentapeptide beta-N-acetylglucosaminyltransferase [unclassified Chelatococcus]|uniref:undecaprenyldiphospho-muramoylpentapeptide beta-N-acetylglucosaminyltransferase n=1 Tax=unclassified Chelatococcus TaxID=2638111 RepID=UPI001BD017FA|nr:MULTISPECIES: undecaprenyldiphospho-muramoylpentapeptide beta-N-acetylglucosaminyltransferase [unclassified Chelatococcus]CAH1666441.1 UDP-N-acetylglucosamine--N-acetylmuramyl-(pentapeptide) pyrophosphoryl-undecaprenol N-acetylglucosamine transferase [Hyphomicrobiales bacterium]MBS7737856.1 undecaprenyldiphospho-muramoylpentapeptide beta-N-acetylglucosaminyltransferase [Chelatococcus sp. HY11]MBX3546696.1 undecaprenyldiphospho-muramoylpentapeptide beta-N-acetylglucosaminyltransferase [Chelato